MSHIEPWVMPTEYTTLGRWGGDGLPASLDNHLRLQALKAREIRGLGTHVAALEALREKAQSVDDRDPYYWMLWLLAVMQGHPYEFEPGELQGKLLAMLGTNGGEAPPAEVTFRELVVAGVNDAFNLLWERSRAAEESEQSESAEAERLRKKADLLPDTERHLREAEAEIEGLTVDTEKLRNELAYLREHYGVETETPVEETAVKEWTRVEGHEGIYFKRNGEGTEKFKFTYRDTEKKQRWKTVATLEEATAEREALLAQPPKPEAIAA